MADPHTPLALPPMSRDVEDNRLAAALAWLWVLSVFMLVVKKESSYVQFHARQGLVVFLVSLALWAVTSILFPRAFLPQQLLKIAVFLVCVTGFVQALRGTWWTLPMIGPIAARLPL